MLRQGAFEIMFINTLKMRVVILFFWVSFMALGIARAQRAPVINSGFNLQNDSIQLSIASDSSRNSINGTWSALSVQADQRINDLLEISKEESIRKGGMDGFRVQIYQGNKERSYQLKSSFLSKYPDYEVYIIFQTPDFRVRIGDFRSRSEALKLKQKIEKDFPNPFIVNDVVNFPDAIQEVEKGD